MSNPAPSPALTALCAGALAGLVVDLVLFPLDTIKTRLQAREGFRSAGGFRQVYQGIGAVIVGSAPGSAMFFLTYDTVQRPLSQWIGSPSITYMLSAALGEIAGCCIRVPVEVIKQRTQTMQFSNTRLALGNVLRQEGISGMYRGYFITVFREVPFSLIQFSLWETFKAKASLNLGHPVNPFEAALCGSVAGAISAVITTPLDVAKTRVMLAQSGSSTSYGNVLSALKLVFMEEGLRGLFHGVWIRMSWISLGGFIFLGTYDLSKAIIEHRTSLLS